MVEIEKIILIILMTVMIGFGTFFGSVGTVNSSNDTNSTNTTDYTDFTSQPVSAMADPTPNGSTNDSTSVSLTVNSSIDLGTVIADGSTYNYTNIQVKVSAQEKKPQGQDKLNLYVKASGDLVGDSDNITLNNLKYDGFSNSSETSFSTDYAQIKTWNFQHDHGNFYTVSGSVTANYYLTVPLGIEGGNYTTNIYYLAIIQQ